MPDVTKLDFIDFPLGFELQRELPPEAHHPKCSQPSMLCDCGAIIHLWRRLRAEAGLPDDDGRYGFPEPFRNCKECGEPFYPEGAVVGNLDKILCVPCIGAALSRITS